MLLKRKSIAIALLATKGGAGKSTLAANFSVLLAEGSRVALVDYDPQLSTANWAEWRGKRPGPSFFKSTPAPADDIRYLKSQGWDWIVMDTPGAHAEIWTRCVAAADFVLIPTQPAAVDIVAVMDGAEHCKAAGKPFAFVLNDCDEAWSITKAARPALRQIGPVIGRSIRTREAYKSTYGKGLAAIESSDKRKAAEAREELCEALGQIEAEIAKRVKA
jgi:chromosome partitioning protein